MEPARKRSFVLLGCLTALVTAIVLTAVSTPAPHTGGDNAGYLLLANSLVSGEGYTEGWDPDVPAHTKYPPVFPLLLGALMIFGASSWAAFKLLVAGLVSVAVLLVFVWGSGRATPLAAAAVAILTLFSAGWLQASRWILSEPAFLVLTFLSLWAAERVSANDDEGESLLSPAGWLTIAGAAAIAALFTRSAGLPLALALLSWLFVSGRSRTAGLFGLALVVPGLWWMLRVRAGGGEGGYQSEFWMVNPYDPELGTVSWTALPVRAWANLRLYVGQVLPAEWWPEAGPGVLAALGIVLFGFSALGWLHRSRKNPSVAEFFVPLYLGLILVWPEVWSGDRFILPLYPLILLYAGDSVSRLTRTSGAIGAPAFCTAGFLLLLLPALLGWLELAEEGGSCRRVAERGDPLRCHGPGFVEFREAAAWAGVNLPRDAVVLNRKPRIHYLLGGPPGRTFPFTQDPDEFLTEADRVGAGYVLLDHVDTISLFYVATVLQARPLAFCHIAGWGGGQGIPGTDLFGILPPNERRTVGEVSEMRRCPDSYLRGAPVDPVIEGRHIPRIASGSPLGQARSPSP